MSSRAQIDAAVAGCSKRDGDEIARMVLQLVRSIVRDPTIRHDTTPEPVHTSPTYLEYQRLVDDAPGAA